ncbi:MAG: hypothetical protein NWF03_06215 [Candidatus Bathyarchaeota archaeon]|nr:hypothetical protein [Candidatus Bathyarchaeota archaeon]
MKKQKKKFVSKEPEKETETMDVYNDKELEQMLEDDEITDAEYNFMLGREKVGKKKSLGLERKEHEDSVADELAKAEYEED